MDQATAPVFTTKETKEALVLAFKAGAVIKLANADGKIDFNDAGLIFTLIPAMGPAFDNISLVPKELGDLSPAEAIDLQTFISNEIGSLVDNAKVVSQINAGLKMIHAMYEFYLTLK